MLKFADGTKLKEHFGDFGYNFAVSDDANATLNYPVEETERILASDEFEKDFRAYLNEMIPNGISIKEKTIEGTKIISVPAYGAYYNLAGWLALAKAQGYKKVSMGTFDNKLALMLAKVCKNHEIECSIIASSKQSNDQTFINELLSLGASVDSKTCNDYFDFPYTYIEVLFGQPPFMSILVTGNYGAFPKPALCGIFAGIYGEDLLEALKKVPECCVVPVNTGLNAISVFKTFNKTNCKLVTYESTVSQEFHVVDTMCYTIKVRRDDDDKDIMICPECAAMWRNGKVARLGCDRVIELDYKKYEKDGLSKIAAKAIAETKEIFDVQEILVVEGE